jgi:hypothetical protein
LSGTTAACAFGSGCRPFATDTAHSSPLIRLFLSQHYHSCPIFDNTSLLLFAATEIPDRPSQTRRYASCSDSPISVIIRIWNRQNKSSLDFSEGQGTTTRALQHHHKCTYSCSIRLFWEDVSSGSFSLTAFFSEDLFLSFLLIPICRCCSSTFSFYFCEREGGRGMERNGIREKRNEEFFICICTNHERKKKRFGNTRGQEGGRAFKQ